MKDRTSSGSSKFYYTGIIILLCLHFWYIFSCCSKKVYDDSKLKTSPISIKKYNIPAGEDYTVPAELGGNGFDGSGWITNDKISILNDENVYKGGKVILSLPNFPVTLRIYGKDYNNYFNKSCGGLLYESLLQLDPVTSDFAPLLATHWKILEDSITFKFRINPNARWAEGNPVTAYDFIDTWKLLINKEILDPFTNQLMETYEEPIAESKYILTIKSKIKSWRQFLYISTSVAILPSQYIKDISGKEFLEKYQYRYIPGSGPYVILESDINKYQSIALRRRSDYWGENERFNKGKNNFDVIKFVINSDNVLEFEKFKKQEIDIIQVTKTTDWKEKFDFPEVKRGLILKRKIFNEFPKGISGICINTKKEPFDDIRVRRAFIYAFNRKKINESLFFNEYILLNSYHAGTVYENPTNPCNGFNLDSSVMLLSEAGWKDKNSNGYLERKGKIFEVDLPFQKGMDRYLTIYQEDLRKIGIKLNLKEIDFASSMKISVEKNFVLLPLSWSSLKVPNPESSYSSKLSESINNLNCSGIADKKIDELIERYNNEPDKNERIKIIRGIDSLLMEYSGYILFWYAPYHRIAFHNQFKYPESILDRETEIESILYLWSFDPEKLKMYNEALEDKSIMLDTGNCVNKFWLQKR
jgi:microcin C transport system substrate-binding protein